MTKTTPSTGQTPAAESTPAPDSGDTPDTAGAAILDPTPDTADAADDHAEDSDGDSDGDERPGNREAAKYRRKLRDAEAERDALTAQLAAAEQAVIGYALGQAGIDPRLWALSEVNIDELRTEGGQLDTGKVIARASEIRAEVYGGPRPNPQQGVPSQRPARSALADAFDPHRQ